MIHLKCCKFLVLVSSLLLTLPAFAAEKKKSANAAKKSATKASSKKNTNLPKVPKSEADLTEGYIIRRTKDGILKIPKKETFRFEGSDVSGSAQKPSQTVLGNRPRSNKATLIPERMSYRQDILNSVGAPAPATQVLGPGR